MMRTCNDDYWKYMTSTLERNGDPSNPGKPCGRTFEDINRSTICPHDEIPPAGPIFRSSAAVEGDLSVTPFEPGMAEFEHIINNPFTAKAVVIEDSIYQGGVRLSTVQETFWRPVLAERNTHKNQYGNSSSSRAIPVEKTLHKFLSEPAYPTSWPAEQKGMQGGAELEGENLLAALKLWRDVQEYIGSSIADYIADHPDKSTRLHKSALNRLMEFGQWHTRVTTATAWENFYDQRCDTQAQPEIRDVALLIRQSMAESQPEEISMGEFHLPYIRQEDRDEVLGDDPTDDDWYDLARISAARCARTSYETMDGRRDLDEDRGLYQGLIYDQMRKNAVVHWSPAEHVATPCPDNRQEFPLTWYDPIALKSQRTPTQHLPKAGALLGWINLRTMEETRARVVTFR